MSRPTASTANSHRNKGPLKVHHFDSDEFSYGADERRGTENMGPGDVVWVGDDGQLDPEEILKKHGYDPYTPLELLLLSIIDAHPDSSTLPRSRSERLDEAISTLLGRPGRRGRDETDDNDILRRIAWRYHEQKFNERSDPKLAPIIRECLMDTNKARKKDYSRSIDAENSTVRRLADKFRREKDVLLTRVTSEMDPDRMYAIHAVNETADRLEELGIKLDRNAIRARLRRTGGNGS